MGSWIQIATHDPTFVTKTTGLCSTLISAISTRTSSAGEAGTAPIVGDTGMQDVSVDFPETGKLRPFDGVSSWFKLKALKVKGIGKSRVHNWASSAIFCQYF